MHSLSLLLMSLFSRMHYLKFVNLKLHRAALTGTAQYGLFLQVEREKYLPVTVLVTGQPLLCSFKSEKKPDDRNKKVNIFITSSLMTKIVDCRFTSSFVVVFVVVKKSWIFISC